MKIRTKNELLQLTLECIDNNFNIYTTRGLCNLIRNMYDINTINYFEWVILRLYLNRHLPKEKYNMFYVWNPEEREPRIKWLKEQIKNTK